MVWPENFSPFGQSSLSSTGDSYTIQDGSWSPFEESVATAAQTTAPNNGPLFSPEDSSLYSSSNAYETAFQINWSPEDLPTTAPWGNFPSNEECKNENVKSRSAVTSPITSPSPILTDSAPNIPEVTRRSSEPSHPKRPRTPKQIKSDVDSKAPRSCKRTKCAPEKPELDASQKKQRSASLASINSPVSQDSRNSHNLIEKQYRNRLNMQFESLLETLPKRPVGEDGEKRVSKAEVLVHANQYIQQLEEETRVLEGKNENLEECVGRWKLKWTKSTGQVAGVL